MADMMIGEGEGSVTISRADAERLTEQLRVLVDDPDERARSGAPEPLLPELDASVGTMTQMMSANGISAGPWQLSASEGAMQWVYRLRRPQPETVVMMFVAPVEREDEDWAVGPLTFQRAHRTRR